MDRIPDYIPEWDRIFHEYRKTVDRLSNCKLITLLVRASTIIFQRLPWYPTGILRHHLSRTRLYQIVRYPAQSFKNLPPPDASRSNSLISFLPPPPSPCDHFIFLSLHQRSRLALSFILPFFFSIFLPPVSHPISSSLSSPDQVRTQEDSLDPSFSTSSFLPSLSRTQKTDMSFPPQGFGLTCLLQGGGKESGSRVCETRGKEGGCRSNSRWFNSLPAFFFHHVTDGQFTCVCWTRMIGGQLKGDGKREREREEKRKSTQNDNRGRDGGEKAIGKGIRQ